MRGHARPRRRARCRGRRRRSPRRSSSASSIGRFESRILPGAERPRLDQLVAGREHADARPRVHARPAARRRSRARRGARGRARVPAARTRGRPASRSPPAAAHVVARARPRRWISTPSSPSAASVRSTITIASAPSGIGAPVMMRIASPGADRRPSARARRRARRRPQPHRRVVGRAARCRRPAPRSRPSRCWRTAAPRRARHDVVGEHQARARRAGRRRPARSGATDAEDRVAGPRLGRDHEMPRVPHEPPEVLGELGAEVGSRRARARCWPAGSRASADVVAAVGERPGRTPARSSRSSPIASVSCSSPPTPGVMRSSASKISGVNT